MERPSKKGVDMKREDDIVCQFIGDHVIGKRKKLKNLKKLNSIPYLLYQEDDVHANM